MIKGNSLEKVKSNTNKGLFDLFQFIHNLIFVGHTIIQILPEISCQGLTKDDLPQLLEQTRNLMQTTFTEISKETKHSVVS